mgnify:CR=1 FL=1
MPKKPRVAVVGATGLVGREILKLLHDRDFPAAQVVPFASARSAGEDILFGNRTLKVEELTREGLVNQCDIALCSAGRNVSYDIRKWVEGTDVVVVDNSSAFRMAPDVPLVVPEVNPEDARYHKGYIANPNCSTIQLVVALHPLQRHFGLKRVVVSTYQSVSGAGNRGVEELSQQSIALFNGSTLKNEIFPKRIAFNVIPHIGPFDEAGYTEEEMKVTHETRKILALPKLGISCTAVRVPVFASHSEAVTVDLDKPADVPGVRAVLAEQPGILLMDNPAEGVYPTPADAVGRPEIFVGRIRSDLSGTNAFHFWVVADNLWKGAALNAVQIAELLVDKDWL